MIINIRIDHKTSDIGQMETLAKDLNDLFSYFNDKYNFKEYIAINTCNRNEYYIHSHNEEVYKDLIKYRQNYFIIEINEDSMKHLLRMASGMESMIIGEDQILGQLKDSLKKSKKEGTCGDVLELLFTKAIHVGQAVRNKTNINRGSVSIGSAAVDLAESQIEGLDGKKVLIIGAGKMGSLVAKSLCEKDLETILVANRTHDRAEKMAQELGGRAIYFDELNSTLEDVDVVISATGAPHKIINYERVEENIPDFHREEVIMIDLANPRDISEDISELGIKLFNIDDLRDIAESNKEDREKESVEAEKIIDEELLILDKAYKHREVENLISIIRREMEIIRTQEQEKALNKIGDLNGNEKVIEKLTKSIVDKVSYDLILNLKKASEENNHEIINSCKFLFNTEDK